MTDSPSLANHFLIAMPTLADPNFFHTVTYVFEHTPEGAMGLVINRPLEIHFSDVAEHMEMEISDQKASDCPVYLGGPVQPDRGFVLHEPVGNWESTLTVTDNFGVTSSRDIVSAIATGQGPRRFLVALGYAGWGAGQLEQEMADNTWLSVPADPEIIFATPNEARWQRAAALLGIDLKNMSSDVGHA